MKHEQIVLAGGCFWCVEAVYRRIDGVVEVESGYAGGSTASPTYEQVCTGTTGHAEVVRVEYDPERVTLRKLVDLFWLAHDPTTLNRQGADVGTQYRSAIFYSTDEQKRIAEESLTDAQRQISDPIVTEITPLETFYPAEGYHQEFYENNPRHGYCRVIIQPKIQKIGLDGAPRR